MGEDTRANPRPLVLLAVRKRGQVDACDAILGRMAAPKTEDTKYKGVEVAVPRDIVEA